MPVDQYTNKPICYQSLLLCVYMSGSFFTRQFTARYESFRVRLLLRCYRKKYSKYYYKARKNYKSKKKKVFFSSANVYLREKKMFFFSIRESFTRFFIRTSQFWLRLDVLIFPFILDRSSYPINNQSTFSLFILNMHVFLLFWFPLSCRSHFQIKITDSNALSGDKKVSADIYKCWQATKVGTLAP